MTDGGGQTATQKPAFGGCFGLLIGGAVLLGAMVFLVIFLDSGANTGQMALREADSYAPGTVEFVGERNFFVVRLADGTFVALADLDAANRAAQGQRCRVAPLSPANPQLPELIEEYRSRVSPAARGATLLFREDCNGATYDLTGLRLDAADRNLDRYETSIDGEGQLVVDVSRRICTQAQEGEFFAEVRC